MNSEKLPYCILPWLHLHIDVDGSMKACCVSRINIGNIKECDSLKEHWEKGPANSIRNMFAKGEFDARCEVCQHREEVNVKSIRQESLEKYGHLWPALKKKPSVKYFDVRFSNQCNLSCRTCWPGASSSWGKQMKKQKSSYKGPKILKGINDIKQFLEEFEEELCFADEIYLAGGEPLIMPEHRQLLEFLVAKKAFNVFLRYNTNMMPLEKDIEVFINHWKKFKRIEILASIDAPGEYGEQIRSGSNWENIKKLRLEISTLTNLSFKIAPTISVLNFAILPKTLIQYIESSFIQPNQIYFNLLDRPQYFNIQSFPLEIKDAISSSFTNSYDKLIELNVNSDLILQLKSMISYMYKKDLSKHWRQLNRELIKIDSLRGEKMHTMFQKQIEEII